MERGYSNALNANPVKDKEESEDLKSGASCSADTVVDQCIDVMFICSEWGSSKGGLSTFNRELAINLAKYSIDRIRLHCYVCQSTEKEREDASRNGIHLITARRPPGSSDPLEWIKIPPSELPKPDIVIGHGRKFGGAAYFIRKATRCRWIHFVHVFCEDIGKYKLECSITADAIADSEDKNRQELELCEASDLAVAVGPLLQRKYRRRLQDIKVEVITPGIFEQYVNPTAKQWSGFESSEEEFSVFMFGRGSFEDFEVKGYDIIGKAVASLERKFELTFVGAPQDEQRKMEKWFLEETKISRDQLTIRGFCSYEKMKKMFREADLVVMPSRTEGFGLVALEAISAGVSVLISRECGIAKALQAVDGGMAVVIPTASPDKWATKIQQLSEQTPDERYTSAVRLRENYEKVYNWKEESKKFEKMILQLATSPTPKETEITEKATCSSKEKAQIQRKEVLTGTICLLAVFLSIFFIAWVHSVPHSCVEVGKSERRGPSESALDSCTAAYNSTEEAQRTIKEVPTVTVTETVVKDSCTAAYNSTEEAQRTIKEVPTVTVTETVVKGATSVSDNNKELNQLHSSERVRDVTKMRSTLPLGFSVDSRNATGRTPLMNQALKGNVQAVKSLIMRGADPSQMDNDGWNSLHFAAQGGDPETIDLILSYVPDIESETVYGETPLICAARRCKLKGVKYLIERGANPLANDINGLNSLHHASLCCQGFMQFLLNRAINSGRGFRGGVNL